MQECRGDDDLLAHALRVLGHPLILRLAEPEQLEQLVAPGSRRLRLEMMQARDQLEILHGGQRIVDGGRLGHVPDSALDLEWLRDHIEARDESQTRRRANQSRQDLHGRGFAGAVRAEETEDLARLDAEVQIVEGLFAAIAAREVFSPDHEAGPARRPWD